MHPGCLHGTAARSRQPQEPAARRRPFPVRPPVLHTDSPGAPKFNHPFLLSRTAIRRPGDEDAEVRKQSQSCWDAFLGSALPLPRALPPSSTQTERAYEHRKDKSVRKVSFLPPHTEVPEHNTPLSFYFSNSLLALSEYWTFCKLAVPRGSPAAACKRPAQHQQEGIHPLRGSAGGAEELPLSTGRVKHSSWGTGIPTGSRCVTSAQEQGDSPSQPGVRR